MKLLKQIFDFYLDSSIHVALAVYALARITMLSFGLGYDEVISYALFFGTIVEYGFIKYSSLAKHYLFVDKKYLKTIQFFGGICFIIAAYYVFRLNYKTLFVAGGLVVLAFLYVVPALTTKRNIRSLKGIKIYIVGLTWSVSTVILPLLNNDMPMQANAYVEVLQRFIYIIAIMIPFEIRDLNTDEAWLRTLPQVLGVRWVKLLGTLLAVFFCVLSLFKYNFAYKYQLVELGVGGLIILSILFATKNRSKYYASFFVESISVVWWLAMLLV
ncbi:hypothetical protein [Galbibacter sp. PAP.153]|uniref:hypothetical protein n=1 Tax=Galbibacter sp. PAP.153 TaxID=3104623 RepID=UPI00300A68CF